MKPTSAPLIAQFVRLSSAFLLGSLCMALFYCHNLSITSGPMYVGMDTASFTLLAVGLLNLLVYLDPSFN